MYFNLTSEQVRQINKRRFRQMRDNVSEKQHDTVIAYENIPWLKKMLVVNGVLKSIKAKDFCKLELYKRIRTLNTNLR